MIYNRRTGCAQIFSGNEPFWNLFSFFPGQSTGTKQTRAIGNRMVLSSSCCSLHIPHLGPLLDKDVPLIRRIKEKALRCNGLIFDCRFSSFSCWSLLQPSPTFGWTKIKKETTFSVRRIVSPRVIKWACCCCCFCLLIRSHHIFFVSFSLLYFFDRRIFWRSFLLLLVRRRFQA